MADPRIAVIGGGPAGSSLGTFIKRYMPRIDVKIFEREKFPRDHIGESLLPAVCEVLVEMGAWDKIEAADFPVKIGATYRWGTTNDLWDFEFIPGEEYHDDARPGKYAGQRLRTAWQVDRSIYDKILLDHAKELGCDVREETRVVKIHRDGDRVTGLQLHTGEMIEADYYVDCSGHSGILRRAMDVGVDYPESLKNVAFWDYWRDAEWPLTVGNGGTRIQVMSLGYGWLWFIPIGPDRTSLGLVVPAEYFKQSGKKAEDMYMEAVTSCPRVGPLIKNARREMKFTTTKDWSFLAERLYGKNWFLCGESAGFADPILSAGLTLAQTGARHLAYMIMAFERGKLDKQWLLDHYDTTQKQRIRQHIQFGNFWYTANEHFSDLKKYVSEIAKDAGIVLDADAAFQWLGTGGFLNDNIFRAGVGEYNVAALKQISQNFTKSRAHWSIGQNNIFKLNLEGAKKSEAPVMQEGRIITAPVWERDGKILPTFGLHAALIDTLKVENRAPQIADMLRNALVGMFESIDDAVDFAFQTLESMIHEGWVTASYSDKVALLPYVVSDEAPGLRWNRDEELMAERRRAIGEGAVKK